MNQEYSTCCQKKETVNFVVNYVFIKPQMYLPQPQNSTSKKQKKSNFFTLTCTAIWILFSLYLLAFIIIYQTTF